MFDYLDYINEKGKIKDKDIKMLEKLERKETYIDLIERDLSQIVRILNFPKDLDVDIFNRICYREGMVGLYWDGKAFQTCSVSMVGLPRKDGRPYKVIARYIDDGKVNVVRDLINDKDIVLCYANAFATPDYHIDWFANILTEVDVSMQACVRYSRYNPILRVKNDTEKQQLKAAIENAELGEIATFVSDNTWSDFLEEKEEPILNINDVKNTDRLQYLEHFNLGLTSRLYSLYGCATSSTGKMAQQTEREIEGKDASSWLVPVDILRQFKAFCERANNLYSEYLEEPLDCRFGSVLMHNYESFISQTVASYENNKERNEELNGTDETTNEKTDETTDEKTDETTNEKTDETTDEKTDDNTDDSTDDKGAESECDEDDGCCVDATIIDDLNNEVEEEISEVDENVTD